MLTLSWGVLPEGQKNFKILLYKYWKKLMVEFGVPDLWWAVSFFYSWSGRCVQVGVLLQRKHKCALSMLVPLDLLV